MPLGFSRHQRMSLLVEMDDLASRSPLPPIRTPSGATSSPSVSLTVNSSFPAAMMSYSNNNPQSSSPTGSSGYLPNGNTGAGGSIIKETVSSSPVKLYKLSDFKGLTYREMANKVEPLMEAIHANPHLQSSLQSILINTATANNGMKDILDSCDKGGLMDPSGGGQYVSSEVGRVIESLNKTNMRERSKEIQALQLLTEAIQSFNVDMLTKAVGLSSRQRQKLLRQFKCTPAGSCLHSFCDKGAWTDPGLHPLLEYCGYRLLNGHIQLYRGSNDRNVLDRDVIRSTTMAVLAIDIVLHKETEGTIL